MNKVLYLDDFLPNRIVVEHALKDIFSIKVVSSAKECFEATKNESYDIVLLDLNLDDNEIDGFQVLERINKYSHLKDTIFIALTNYIGDNWEQRCLKSGFHYYFPKPFTKKHVEQMITCLK